MMLQNMHNRKLITFSVFIGVLVLSLRLLSSAYTSGDDGYTYMAANAPHGWIKATWEMVVFQGRFYQLFVYPLAMLPFQFDNVLVANLFKIFTFSFFFISFVFLLRQFLTREQSMGCAALFILIFETVGGSYNAFHGLPLWFGLVCGMMMASLAFFYRALKSESRLDASMSVLCYAWAIMGYEVILLYTPLFVIISIYHRLGTQRLTDLFNMRTVCSILRDVTWFIFVSCVYLGLYFTFRKFYPGTYVGAQGFSYTNLAEVWKPVWEFSLNSIQLFPTISEDKTFSVTSLLFALLLSIGVVASLLESQKNKHLQKVKIKTSQKAVIVLALVVYIFVPNLLFGFTQRYRIWAADGVEVYLGSMYSAVCLCILGYLVLSKALGSATMKKSFVAAGLTMALTFSGYLNSKNSENFFKQSNMMSVRWDVASELQKEISIAGLNPAEAHALCSYGFIRNQELPVYFRNPDLIADVKLYWGRYFSQKTGLNFTVINMHDQREVVDERQCAVIVRLSYANNQLNFKVAGKTHIFKLSELKSIPNLVDSPNRIFGL